MLVDDVETLPVGQATQANLVGKGLKFGRRGLRTDHRSSLVTTLDFQSNLPRHCESLHHPYYITPSLLS